MSTMASALMLVGVAMAVIGAVIIFSLGVVSGVALLRGLRRRRLP